MLRLTLCLVLLLNCAGVFLKSTRGNREKRWFGYSYTSTVVKPHIVTSLVPSSCVQVEPSLPPCRNVRYLNHFPNIVSGRLFSGNSINFDDDDDTELKSADSLNEPTIETTPLGWGEYLGFVAPTVTTTAIHVETTTMMDPRTIVTFSVRGCKPSRLPLDLETCPPSPKPILPTRTSKEVMTSTVYMPELNPPEMVQGAESEIAAATPLLQTEELKESNK